MKEKNKKFNPNPKELSFLEKAGTCVFIHDFVVVNRLTKELLEEALLGEKEKLSQEKVNEIRKEIATYICFETIKQIKEYQKGLSGDAAHKVSNTISYYFVRIFGIKNLLEELKGYGNIENPGEHVSKKILKIATGVIDFLNQWDIYINIMTMTAYILYEGIGRMLRLPEEKMEGVIEDFFTNIYPQYSKELSFLEKVGICVSIYSFVTVARFTKTLKEEHLKEEELSKEKVNEIRKEVAIYICFETVKCIREHQKEISKDAAYEISNVISHCFVRFFCIKNLSEKLKEYESIENLAELKELGDIEKGEYISNKILKIMGIIDKNGSKTGMCDGIISTANYILFKEIEQILRSPEETIEEMRKAIESFSTKYYQYVKPK